MIRKTYHQIVDYYNKIRRYIFYSNFERNLKIYEVRKLQKLGTDYGGWIVPLEFINSSSICYSVGAGEDLSFDCELANRFDCSVNIFDPTPRAKKHFQDLKDKISNNEKMMINNTDGLYYDIDSQKLNLLSYFDYGLWINSERKKFYAPGNPLNVSCSILNLQKTKDYFEAECKRLSQIMKELNHQKIDLLKLDIEGAEHEVIKSIIEDNLDIKLICIDFDELTHNKFKRTKETIESLLNKNYLIIAREDESNYTFLRKDIYQQLI